MRLSCPNSGCGQTLEIADGDVGKKCRCPKCGAVFTVPEAKPQPRPDGGARQTVRAPQSRPASQAPPPAAIRDDLPVAQPVADGPWRHRGFVNACYGYGFDVGPAGWARQEPPGKLRRDVLTVVHPQVGYVQVACQLGRQLTYAGVVQAAIATCADAQLTAQCVKAIQDRRAYVVTFDSAGTEQTGAICAFLFDEGKLLTISAFGRATIRDVFSEVVRTFAFDPAVTGASAGAMHRGRSKGAALALAWFLGIFGAHSFYLGATNAGVAQILLTVGTCGFGAVLGVVEFFVLLFMSREAFDQRYNFRQPGKWQFTFTPVKQSP